MAQSFAPGAKAVDDLVPLCIWNGRTKAGVPVSLLLAADPGRTLLGGAFAVREALGEARTVWDWAPGCPTRAPAGTSAGFCDWRSLPSGLADRGKCSPHLLAALDN